jgi:hypothetical protein
MAIKTVASTLGPVARRPRLRWPCPMSKKARTAPPARGLSTQWRIHFFQRHPQDDPRRDVPGRDFLNSCPEKVRTMMLAVVKAVAEAPPPRFAGGGKWEAMHDEMKGYYEVRVDGPRHHYLLPPRARKDPSLNLGGPSVVIITGKDKQFLTELSEADYAEVRRLGAEYRARKPRSVLA